MSNREVTVELVRKEAARAVSDRRHGGKTIPYPEDIKSFVVNWHIRRKSSYRVTGNFFGVSDATVRNWVRESRGLTEKVDNSIERVEDTVGIVDDQIVNVLYIRKLVAYRASKSSKRQNVAYPESVKAFVIRWHKEHSGSYRETSEHFGISNASIRNWCVGSLPDLNGHEVEDKQEMVEENYEEDTEQELEDDKVVVNMGYAEETANYVAHSFCIRPEHTVIFELPFDFSGGEAERFVKFIRSIPFTKEVIDDLEESDHGGGKT